MEIVSHILSTLFGCGLFLYACVPTLGDVLRIHQSPSADTVTQSQEYKLSTQLDASSASSSRVIVTTDINGSTTKKTVDAPYGVRTAVFLRDDNGVLHREASTTPLSKADIDRMTAEAASFDARMDAMQRQMDQMFKEQEESFRALREDSYP